MRSRTPLPQRQQAHWGAFLEAAALFLALCVLGRSAALTLAAVVAAPFPAVQTALWWGQRNLQSETSDPEPEPAAEEQAPPASSAVPEALQALTGGIEDYLVALQPEDARPADAGAVIEKQYPQGSGEKYIACGAGSIKNNTRQTAADLAAEIENPLPFAIEKDSPDPQVLVMHTHATEDYRLSAGLWFTPGDGARSTDRSINMCAVGRWVLFVDCDDCLLPDAVETLLAAQARTGADIVQGGWQYCDEADTRGAVQQYAEACYTGPRRLDVVELPGTPWGKLYRRTLFERVRFPSGYTCFEDAMIHFWVFPRAKCIASTKPAVYLWRKNTMGLTATSQNTAKALQAYWVAEEMLDGAVRLGLPQDALFACNLILQLANYCYVCVAGLPEADRQTAFACCCLLYRRWAAKLPDPRTLPYAVRLAQRALEQADYGLWQLQGRLFQLIN